MASTSSLHSQLRLDFRDDESVSVSDEASCQWHYAKGVARGSVH
jgi:hypothetical protein